VEIGHYTLALIFFVLHIKLANNLQTSASNDTVACSFASSAIEPLACF